MLNKLIYKQPVMVFLGAGASAPLGMKTTLQFMTSVLTERGINSNLISEIITSVTPSEELDKKVDIEAVLDYLEKLIEAREACQKLLGVLPSSFDEIIKLRDQIEDLVVTHYSEIDAPKAFKHYEPLFEELAPFYSVPVFTTNYDLSIEKAYEHPRAQFQLIDGFKKTRRTIPHWSQVEYNNYKPRRRKEIILFKLHGSVDWVRAPHGELQRVGAGERNPGNLKTVLVYPTRTKKEIHEEPFRINYDYLLACLAHTKLCLVIGFSFRDQEISEHFRAAAGINQELMLLIADTNPNIANHTIRKFETGGGFAFMKIEKETIGDNIRPAIHWLREIVEEKKISFEERP